MAYVGDQSKIEVSAATWNAIIHYIKTLHKERAVDDTKMKFAAYFPLEHCMKLWGIEPYKVQHDWRATPPRPPEAGREEVARTLYLSQRGRLDDQNSITAQRPWRDKDIPDIFWNHYLADADAILAALATKPAQDDVMRTLVSDGAVIPISDE